MKYKRLLFLLVGLVLLFPAQAGAETDLKEDLAAATTKAVEVYKKHGMLGLIVETENCYKDATRDPFYCVHFDLASRYIDYFMIAGAARLGATFPKMEFFEDELFGRRIIPAFKKANMTMEEGNAYLRLVTPIINGLVESHLLSVLNTPE